MRSEGEWEPVAEQWVRWVRTPRHDAYWYYRDGFFNQVMPSPGRRTIEVGCGEGRVARDLCDAVVAYNSLVYPIGGTLPKCDPSGTPSTSHWTGAATIVQSLRTKTCTVTPPRTSAKRMPFSLAGRRTN